MHPCGQLLTRYRHREIPTFSRDMTGHEILSLILGVGLKTKDKSIFFTEFQRKENQCGCWMPAPPMMEKHFQFGKHLIEKLYFQTTSAWWMCFHLGEGGWAKVFAGIRWGQALRGDSETRYHLFATVFSLLEYVLLMRHPQGCWQRAGAISVRAGLREPLLYSDGSRLFSVYVSRFAFGHGLSASPLFLSLFWFLCVKKKMMFWQLEKASMCIF